MEARLRGSDPLRSIQRCKEADLQHYRLNFGSPKRSRREFTASCHQSETTFAHYPSCERCRSNVRPFASITASRCMPPSSKVRGDTPTPSNPSRHRSISGSAGRNNQNSRAALGMELTPVTPDIAGQVGAPRGTHGLVVTSVDPGSLAADAGIREGDIVQQVNRQPIRTAADVSAALAKSKDRPALLQILREGRSLFIAVSVA
jgi:hypothetical protein